MKPRFGFATVPPTFVCFSLLFVMFDFFFPACSSRPTFCLSRHCIECFHLSHRRVFISCSYFSNLHPRGHDFFMCSVFSYTRPYKSAIRAPAITHFDSICMFQNPQKHDCCTIIQIICAKKICAPRKNESKSKNDAQTEREFDIHSIPRFRWTVCSQT